MPRWVLMLMTVVPPLVLVGVAGLVLRVARDFRRSFGASSGVTPGAVVVACLFLLVHGGYLAAPFLVGGERRSLGLWLTTPLAVLATLALVAMMGTEHLRPSVLGQGAALYAVTVGGLMLAYWAPVAALAWGR